MSLSDLPLELLYLIVTSDPHTWRKAVTSIPFVHRTFTSELERIKRKFTVVKVGEDTETYELCGKLHREDGPARTKRSCKGVVYEWFFLGKRHREGGPALSVREKNKTKGCWYHKGVKHREDGPALYKQTPESAKIAWYRNGMLHRKKEPALLVWGPDGNIKSLYWYVCGGRHRKGGPACIKYENGDKIEESWWVRGKKHRYERDEYGELLPATIKYGEYEDDEVIKYWWYQGQLHREDGPAIEKPDGCIWMSRGKWHRDEVDERGRLLPAFVMGDYKAYFLKGMEVDRYGKKLYEKIGKETKKQEMYAM